MQYNSVNVDFLNDCWLSRTPFIAWKKPGKKAHQIINPEISLWNGNFEDGFIIAPFLGLKSNKVILAKKNESKLFLNWNEPSLPILSTKSEFLNLCENAIKAIQKGDLKKVVVSRVKEIELNKDDLPGTYFDKLCALYNKSFISIISLPEYGTWIGASPEQLLGVSNGISSIASLAGTRFNDMEQPSFSAKEYNEQAIVTQFIIEKVSSVGIQNLNVVGPKPVLAGNLFHLKSKVSGNIEKEKLTRLLEILHPTPAVAGTPYEKATDFIQKNEKHRRDLYCGFIGTLTKEGNVDFYVNLRSMRWTENKAYLYVGCGITQDSLPEDEWNETEFKARTLSDVL